MKSSNSIQNPLKMVQQSIGLSGYFKVQRFCLSKMGINILTEERIIESYVRNLLASFALIADVVTMCHYGIVHFDDVEAATSALGPGLQILLSLSKWVTFLIYRREIVQLVRRIWEWNLESTEAERALLVEENQKDIRLCRLYCYMFGMAGVIAFTTPFFFAIRTYLREGNYKLDPPVLGTYMIDYTKPLNYVYLDLFLVYSAFCSIFASIAIDGLFSWFTRNIIAQFRILELRLKQAAQENDGNVSTQTLKSCIQYHYRIIEAADEFNSAFGIIIFVKFTNSCLQACFVAFQVANMTSDTFFQLLFGSTIGLQLILYCWSGQGLKDASVDIADCIYEVFKWEKVGIEQRKMLLLSMQRSQRGCSLAGMFFTVDMELFVWVIQTAGSYVTLLLSMTEN